VDPYLNDWLNLLIRWLHVIAGIAWIGSSFYFVFLDSHLLRPRAAADAERGVGGEAWEVHGGGFYHVQKYRIAPPSLPGELLWFKWEAYTTWLSGFALLVVLYYVNADTYLIDPAVADISTATAIVLSMAGLALAWGVYDLLCRLLGGRELLLAASILVFLTASAWAASELFSGRAVYIQVGAMIGTMMVGNVLLNIIPAHRQLIHAKEEGREPDPAPALEAKRRSVHNNYLTLPVVLTMIGNHFPFTYGRDYGWLILVVLMLIGAWVRHFFNLRHEGRTVWAIPASAAVATVALALVIQPDEPEAPSANAPVAFAQVHQILAQRCAVCHSASPTHPSVSSAPLGIALDTPEQIGAVAEAIERVAVESEVMPPGNVTGMTAQERAVVAAWIGQGAETR
jgi:uncharacterized membrane protein